MDRRNQKTRIAFPLLLLLVLSFAQSQSARAEIATIIGAPRVADVATLEKAYKEHSLVRNRIAAQLKFLWREEKFLKENIAYRGEKGDLVEVRQDQRELLQVRFQIDDLREQLSRENRALEVIGEQIPD